MEQKYMLMTPLFAFPHIMEDLYLMMEDPSWSIFTEVNQIMKLP
jgi:hypothetical protein